MAGKKDSYLLCTDELCESDRSDVMKSFRRCENKVLVTIDSILRGLDFPNVKAILNFNLPTINGSPAFDSYVHRIGRGARFGNK